MSGSSIRARIEEAAALLQRAKAVVVSTGAGISAESGVPTFRGEGGLWKRHRPEDLATPGAFQRDPQLVWEWYAWRREKVAACAPNAAHHALAHLALSRPGVTLVTQNVDGLHVQAAREVGALLGVDPAPALPLELHGDLFRVRCRGCGAERETREPIDASSLAALPRCRRCGDLERPGVVWFGEALPAAALGAAMDAAEHAEVCVVVGTSALVYPAAAVPLATLARGGSVIEINPDETPLTARATISIRGSAGRTVPRLVGRPPAADPDDPDDPDGHEAL